MPKHPKADLLIAIANGEQFQIDKGDGWFDIHPEIALIKLANGFPSLRIKPKTININGIEVPAPVTEPLEIGQEYWTWSHDKVLQMRWNGDRADHRWLKRRAIHLTEEAAQAHLEAIVKASGGEV